jgi:hypothetical protein
LFKIENKWTPKRDGDLKNVLAVTWSYCYTKTMAVNNVIGRLADVYVKSRYVTAGRVGHYTRNDNDPHVPYKILVGRGKFN